MRRVDFLITTQTSQAETDVVPESIDRPGELSNATDDRTAAADVVFDQGLF